MEPHGGDIIARFLQAREIPFIFTLCGGHISPILVAAKQRGIRVVDLRHEVNAVFAADATARLTGKPGVAVVTAGPGVTNTVTALKNAALAQSPVILLGGAAATVLKGRGALQDIDQLRLMRTVAKEALTIKRNCDIVPVLESAFITAQSGIPGPVFIECPIDLLYPESLVRKWYGAQPADQPKAGLRRRLLQLYLDRHVDRMFACSFDEMGAPPWAPAPLQVSDESLRRTAAHLSSCQRPIMVLGSQAVDGPAHLAELIAALERIGVPVYCTGMARGLMGRTHPLQLRHQRRAALREADLVILAGMPCDFRLNYGKTIGPKAFVVGINRSRHDLRLNRMPQLAVQADPSLFLRQLALRLAADRCQWAAWTAELHAREAAREADIRSQSREPVDGVNPLAFLLALDDFLDERALLIADGGDFVASAAYTLRPSGPLGWLDPGVFGTLGVGAGFALGAKLCRPDKEVWLLYGDGSAGYSLAEFDSLARHGLPLIAVVGNDAGWTQIARDQVTYLQDDVATVLAPTDYHTVAEGFGARGLLLNRAADIPRTLQTARETAARGQAVLINLLIGRTRFREGSISM